MKQAALQPSSPPAFFLSRPSAHDEQVRLGIAELNQVDLLWRLYNAFPNKGPRLEQSKAAAGRIDWRRSFQTRLPQRAEFATTVDYYEAAMPLLLAHHRAIKQLRPNTYMRAVHKAIGAIFPGKLF